MRALLFAVAVLLLGGAAPPVWAQGASAPCVTSTDTSSGATQVNCARVSAAVPLPVTATSGGGASSAKVVSAATTNSTLIGAAGARLLLDVVAINTNAATAYLKFYNKATAPTCASDAVVATYPLVQNVPVVTSSFVGRAFSLGLGLCITAGIADNDNTSATTGIVVNVSYK